MHATMLARVVGSVGRVGVRKFGTIRDGRRRHPEIMFRLLEIILGGYTVVAGLGVVRRNQARRPQVSAPLLISARSSGRRI
jgi:hypothetical protein